ncbi:autotransporter-associated beta strand repeat-containing protein [Pseudomonas sp. S2_F03]
MSPVLAETFTWAGASCYTCPESWTPQGVPENQGDIASFTNVGNDSISVDLPVNPSSWEFVDSGNKGHDYAISGLPVAFDGPGLIVNSPELITINNNLGGIGGVIQNGAGGTLVLTGDNTYTGGTTINAGTLSINTDSNLGAPGGTLTIGNGTLRTKQTFATNRPVTLTGNATLIQAVDTGFTLNGVISGSGSFALDGDGGSGGLVTLNASNTYTGATNLNAGFLFINGSIATSSQLITNQGTFLGGTGILPQTTVGGFVSPGPARDTTGTLNIAGEPDHRPHGQLHRGLQPLRRA